MQKIIEGVPSMGKTEEKTAIQKAAQEAYKNWNENGKDGAEENLAKYWRLFAYEGFYLKQFLEACCGKHRSNIEHNSKIYKIVAPLYKEFQRECLRSNVSVAIMTLTRSAATSAKNACYAVPVRKDQIWAMNKVIERDERRERQKRWEQEMELRRRELEIKEKAIESRNQLRQIIITMNLTYDKCKELINLSESEYKELMRPTAGLLADTCAAEAAPALEK